MDLSAIINKVQELHSDFSFDETKEKSLKKYLTKEF